MRRLHDSRLLIWWSVAWALGTFAIAPLVNYVTPFLNGSYANEWTPDIYWRLVLYWHGGIFIPWVVVLAVLVCRKFHLDALTGIPGRMVCESVFVGGFFAVPIASIAGIFDIYDNFALGIPLWTQIFAFLIGDEIAIALLVAMVIYPRVSGGYRRAGMPYYTAFVGVFAALIAAVMGHVGGWITWFGPYPSVAAQYVNSTMYPVLGFYNSTTVVTFTENVVTSHSHLMLPALMVGVVALIAAYFGYYEDWGKNSKRVAAFGFAWMIAALLAVIWIYVASGLGNYQTPTLFAGPNGVNGVAQDDLFTGMAGFGAIFVLAGLLAHSLKGTTGEGTPLYKDPLFLAVVAGWVMIYLVIPITGYYIEFHETYFAAAGLSFDQAYLRWHQDFGFFVLPALITLVLALDTYGISGRARNAAGGLLICGSAFAFVFGELYVFVALRDWILYTAVFGGILMGVGALVGVYFLAEEDRRFGHRGALGAGGAIRAPPRDRD